jgi:hypothetical protein
MPIVEKFSKPNDLNTWWLRVDFGERDPKIFEFRCPDGTTDAQVDFFQKMLDLNSLHRRYFVSLVPYIEKAYGPGHWQVYHENSWRCIIGYKSDRTGERVRIFTTKDNDTKNCNDAVITGVVISRLTEKEKYSGSRYSDWIVRYIMNGKNVFKMNSLVINHFVDWHDFDINKIGLIKDELSDAKAEWEMIGEITKSYEDEDKEIREQIDKIVADVKELKDRINVLDTKLAKEYELRKEHEIGLNL